VQKQKRARLILLEDTERLLCDLERRLQYSEMPLADWLETVAKMPQYVRLTFLEDTLTRLPLYDFETAWRTAVENMQGFSREDSAALQLLGVQLGKSDTATQLQCVRETVCAISECKEKAVLEAEKAQKLYVGLGTCAGMAVAILLI